MGIDIFGDLLVIVTRDAQITLQILRKCSMTFAAVFFELSMALDHLAGHDQ